MSPFDDGKDFISFSEMRNSKTLDIIPSYNNPIEWFELNQLIWQYGDLYAKEFGIVFSKMEDCQILHYSTSNQYYKPHIDSGSMTPRIFSALLYLNDVEEGGETYFNLFDVSIKPRAGRLALFPAQYTYLHEALPPKSNEKFVVVTWFNELISA